MEEMEARLCERLAKFDEKLDLQAQRMDQVQMKVDLSMEKLGKLEEDQIAVMRAVQDKGPTPTERPPPLAVPPAPRDGIIGPRPASAPLFQVTPFSPLAIDSPECSKQREHVRLLDDGVEVQSRRPWMPRMDFP